MIAHDYTETERRDVDGDAQKARAGRNRTAAHDETDGGSAARRRARGAHTRVQELSRCATFFACPALGAAPALGRKLAYHYGPDRSTHVWCHCTSNVPPVRSCCSAALTPSDGACAWRQGRSGGWSEGDKYNYGPESRARGGVYLIPTGLND